MTDLKKTPFNVFHHDLGAKLVDFSGWEMPLSYSRILTEHACVRESVGLFDVSHMGEVFIRGAKAEQAVQYLVTNSMKLTIGEAQYSCLCNHQGGIIDDLIVYRLDQNEFLVCVNAANQQKDFEWMFAQNPYPSEVEVINSSADYAQIAIQGRHASSTLQKLTEYDLSTVKYYGVALASVAGVADCIVARTGYTGEDGFEVFLPKSGASVMWPAITEAGAEFGLQPIGLAARDTLRLEARMHLYGNDMNIDTTPYDASLGWTVDLSKDDFVGKQALIDHKNNHWKKRLVGLKVERRIPRPGCQILHNGVDVGQITSGTRSPTLGYGVAFGYVPRSLSRAGTQLKIDVRGKQADAVVVKGPFYKKDY